MGQPGLDVRPLRQITGATHFFEVFFDEVRTPADWIVGARGEGLGLLVTTQVPGEVREPMVVVGELEGARGRVVRGCGVDVTVA